MAAANTTKEAIWLRVLLEDLGYPRINATIIHTDNQDCIALACNPVTHTHAKHIDICHHFIRECVESQEINLWYCSTKDMIADILLNNSPGKLSNTSGMLSESRRYRIH